MWGVYVQGLAWILPLALGGWLLSVLLANVSLVDSLWSLMFLCLTVCFAHDRPLAARGYVVLVLVGIWALRLSLYITARNLGEGEDRRYRQMRARNQPHFAWKSLYLVFLFQALLSWLISLPLWGALMSDAPLRSLDAAGAGLWLLGFTFEACGDWQLQRFKRNPANAGAVLDHGLWRYTRHPNYFGECCIWWGYYLLAAGAGAWWSIPAPLLMSFLLLKVSGVALLERSIGERRPRYAEYVRRTNAFIPGRPK